ncbi:hypothetical protein L873DRAFT_347846 [Choiromyces venosus 120613-1]|uniref:Uncharacterized protein n=1 Tax=Choiromyces venosus 120613-1 TaxID=1336337 RepID=A0A3N4J3J0_9PEZI|nr:hypothetical protein L873DRAFT_347846 [Choiromyces venosus 120613-1]
MTTKSNRSSTPPAATFYRAICQVTPRSCSTHNLLKKKTSGYNTVPVKPNMSFGAFHQQASYRYIDHSHNHTFPTLALYSLPPPPHHPGELHPASRLRLARHPIILPAVPDWSVRHCNTASYPSRPCIGNSDSQAGAEVLRRRHGLSRGW